MSYSIEVVNIRLSPEAEYIGRPSPLGNPFEIGPGLSRDKVCDEFDAYFEQKVHELDTDIITELKRLHLLGKCKRKIKLGCFCKPYYRCHGDGIKQWMEDNYELLELWTDENTIPNSDNNISLTCSTSVERI